MTSQPQMLREGASSSTRTNALYSLQLLRESDVEPQRLVVVTSRFHALRSALVFKRVLSDAGLTAVDVVTLPVAAEHERHARQLDFWRELAAIALYWVMGWL